jgi:membrane associated rhomboid family serine protease
MEPQQSLFSRIRKRDPLMMILIINLVVFVAIQLHLLNLFLAGEKASLPLGEDLMLAANSSVQIMMQRPWSLITHLFAHIQPGHFLFNMIALYSMGKLFTTMVSPRKLWLIYFLGGISGYLLFLLSFSGSTILNAGRDYSILGASASAMAIVTATAIIQPSRIVYLFNAVRLELAWLAIILVVLDLASIRNGINSGGHIGHLGGALFGLLYGIGVRFGITRWRDVSSFFSGLMKRSSMRTVHRQARPKTDDEFNAERAERQKKIDNILDKIGRSGYESLSQSEKDFLFKHSQK